MGGGGRDGTAGGSDGNGRDDGPGRPTSPAFETAAAAPDGLSGRLPLHLALCAGKMWEVGGAGALFQAYPDAATIPDPVTGLYPFMLAAAKASLSSAPSSWSGVEEEEEREEGRRAEEERMGGKEKSRDDYYYDFDENYLDEDGLDRLGTVYELLRSCPHLIGHCRQ